MDFRPCFELWPTVVEGPVAATVQNREKVRPKDLELQKKMHAFIKSTRKIRSTNMALYQTERTPTLNKYLRYYTIYSTA